MRYLANSTDKCVLVLQVGVVVGTRLVENTPALGALQHRAWSVTVVAVPVVVSHSLYATHNSLYHCDGQVTNTQSESAFYPSIFSSRFLRYFNSYPIREKLHTYSRQKVA